MIVQHLFKVEDQPDVISYLLAHLSLAHCHPSSPCPLLLFYLPQLCFLAITKEQPACRLPIERFVVRVAVTWEVVGIKTLQWFSSWAQDEEMTYQKKAQEMYTTLETAIVNCCLPQKYKTQIWIYDEAYEQLIHQGYLIVDHHNHF